MTAKTIRTLLTAMFGAILTAAAASPVTAASAAEPRRVVDFDGGYEQGTIVIRNSERRLYYVLPGGKAVKYSVAIGTPRNQWRGETHVVRKRKNPGWSPTPNMRRRNPRLPRYMPPGPRNPLGVRALYLGWSAYRIHGTSAPGSIGRAVSNGCIRMYNKDVIDLFERVHIGAPVVVVN